MAIDRKTITATDTVYVAYSGCDHSGPYARVTGGEVVATSEDGSFAYRRFDGGKLDSVPAYWVCTVHATEAEAWEANADRLLRIAGEVAAKAHECQMQAMQKVTA